MPTSIRTETTKRLAAICAALVLMAGGAVAYSAIPSASHVFTACVTKTTGAVRLYKQVGMREVRRNETFEKTL